MPSLLMLMMMRRCVQRTSAHSGWTFEKGRECLRYEGYACDFYLQDTTLGYQNVFKRSSKSQYPWHRGTLLCFGQPWRYRGSLETVAGPSLLVEQPVQSTRSTLLPTNT